MTDYDEYWMGQALELAQKAAQEGEVPVGAIVVRDGQLLGSGFNRPISSCDPTAHAEINALRDASKKAGNYRLTGTTLYVTLEPCAMCAGAIVHARVGRIVFAAQESKAGAVVSQQQFFDSPWLNHKVEVTSGVLKDDCSKQLSRFFQQRRDAKRALKKLTNVLKEHPKVD